MVKLKYGITENQNIVILKKGKKKFRLFFMPLRPAEKKNSNFFLS